MNALAFIDTCKKSTRPEHSGSLDRFLDFFALAGHPLPDDFDPTGKPFTDKKLVANAGGARGFTRGLQ